MTEDRQMNIKMDPQIYQIFKESQNVSGKYIELFVSRFVLQFKRAYPDIC